MKTSILPTRMVIYSFQRTAILKLSKPVACPLHTIATQSHRGEGEGEEKFGGNHESSTCS